MDELSKDTYISFKKKLDAAMHQAAEAFVQIGYLLRKAKETDVLTSSGYDNVNDFAKGEYGLSPDQVSRYIAINERFSVGGYAPELRDDMKGYGIGKLQIMLTLPDEVVEVIPQEVTKQEVTEIQKEVKQEQNITDIEVMLEEPQTQPAYLGRPMDPLEKFYVEYFYEQKMKWARLYDALNVALPDEYDKEVANALCPSGIGVIRARVPGEGMMMLTFRGKQNSITLLNVRSGEKTEYAWDELAHPFTEMYMKHIGDKEEAWFNAYNEHFTEQAEESERSEEKAQEVVEESERSEEKAQEVVEESEQPEETEQKKEEVAPVQSLPDRESKRDKGLTTVEVVPGVEVEIDVEKASEAAKRERLKGEIQADNGMHCTEEITVTEKNVRDEVRIRHLEAAEGAIADIKRYMKEERWMDAIVSAEALSHYLTEVVKEVCEHGEE